MGRHVQAGEVQVWTEQVGDGPDVLLIGGLGDTVESWQFQLDGLADRYRLTAFDNRGAGRTAMPPGPLTVEAMADDAAAVLRELDIPSAHVAGFSGGSLIAQELALRHAAAVRSLVLQSTWAAMDHYVRTLLRIFRWQAAAAPSERDFLEAVAAEIPGATFEVMDGEAHQPFQEVPELWNARVHAFWQDTGRQPAEPGRS
jgi:3-oxoadipate enol-lactonase